MSANTRIHWVFTLLRILALFTRSTRSDFVNSEIDSSTGVAPLVLENINLVVVTDVHSWIAGHKHKTELDANYGDVLSFYEHLKNRCIESMDVDCDIFFVMNGDFIDGTGFSSYPPEHLTPILQRMPFDAINIGNHELYRNSTIEYITEPNGFVDSWQGRYLTSNVLLQETGQPIGNRYTFLKGERSQKNILVFGFLYNFQNNCLMTEVENVTEVVNAQWFQDVLRGNEESFDAIVVLAHMDYDDPLVHTILAKIRIICGNEMPVQFITGHSHEREYKQLDNFSSTFEAGKYLDTIGFASLSFKNDSVAFDHQFINGNVNDLEKSLGQLSESFETINGKELTSLIKKTESELGLNERLGCNLDKTYYLHRGLEQVDSLWRLYAVEIIPKQFFKGSTQMLFIQNSGGLRYDLYKGNVTVNDLITVCPYNDTVFKVGEVNGKDFLEAFPKDDSDVPSLVVSGEAINAEKQYQLYTTDFDLKYVKEQLENITGIELDPTEQKQSTCSIIKDYIDDTWSCPEIVKEPEPTWQQKFIDFFESFTVVKFIAFIITFFVILFFGWMFLCRHPHQRLSDEDSVEDEASFGDNSGIDFSTGSDDDGSLFPVSAKTPTNSYNSMHGSRSYQTVSEENEIV